MESNVLTRQELYKLVWSEPLTSIVKKYQVTDHLIRKVCKEMCIPLPGYGYWPKIKWGKDVFIEELPEPYTGKLNVDLSSIHVPDKDNITVFSPAVILRKQIESDSKLKLTVPPYLTNPDPLISKAKDNLNRKDRYFRPGNFVHCQSGYLDIGVSKENIGRALRIMDTLIKAMQHRGHQVTCHYQRTTVSVLGVDMKIKLRELRKRIPNPKAYSSDYVATGILCFRMEYSWKSGEWRDGRVPLEDQLSRILAKIELSGQQLYEERIQRQKAEDERKERERIRQEYEARKLMELNDFKELLSKSKRRFKAEMIRNFIDTTEQRAIEKGTMDDRLANWIVWASGKADWYDPFMESDDELLRGADRKSLTFPNR